MKKKYPKTVVTFFLDLPESIEDNSPFENRQLNVHVGNKFLYWFIESQNYPIKLACHLIPDGLLKHYSREYIIKQLRDPKNIKK
jgi:hypothetical protein